MDFVQLCATWLLNIKQVDKTMLMKKQIICTALAVFVVMCTSAQGLGEIQGKVLDGEGLAAIGAFVQASNGIESTTGVTNVDGRYRINHLRPGKYDLMISMQGMDTIRYFNVSVDPEQISFVPEITILPYSGSSYTTGTVKISADRDPLIHKDAEHIQTWRSEDIKHLPTAHGGKIANIVQSMSSDIKPAGEGSGMSIRGSREGGTLIYVDGVKIRNTDISVPASGISSVSVYTAGVPAKYGDTTSGVILVNTKSYTEEYYKKLAEE
jgi:hypothetical protein